MAVEEKSFTEQVIWVAKGTTDSLRANGPGVGLVTAHADAG